MTGRRLYDRYCDARKREEPNVWNGSTGRYQTPPALKAWPYLERWERTMWNGMARAITNGTRYT